MPTISTFYGILIQIFWNDHAPPHFHALYADDEVLIDIRTLEVMRGQLPRRALALVLEWAQERRTELIEDWELCSQHRIPKKIPPLPQARHYAPARRGVLSRLNRCPGIDYVLGLLTGWKAWWI